MQIDRLSFSAIQTYLNNEYEFYNTYILKKPLDYGLQPALRIGNQVHATIENITQHYAQQKKETPDATTEQALANIDQYGFVRTDEPDAALAGGEITQTQYDDMLARVTNAIDNWYMYFLHNPIVIEKTEAYVRAPISSKNSIELSGKIDAIIKNDDNSRTIIDYKTTNNIEDEDDPGTNIVYELQAGAYISLMQAYNVPVDKVQFVQIAKKERKTNEGSLLKVKIQKICDEKKIEYNKKDTKQDLIDKMTEAGAVTYTKTVGVKTYKNTEQLAQQFCQLFDDVVDRIQKQKTYIANPFFSYMSEADAKKRQEMYAEYIQKNTKRLAK